MVHIPTPAEIPDGKRKLKEFSLAANSLAIEHLPKLQRILDEEDYFTSELWWKVYELMLKYGVSLPKQQHTVEGEIIHRPVVELPARDFSQLEEAEYEELPALPVNPMSNPEDAA